MKKIFLALIFSVSVLESADPVKVFDLNENALEDFVFDCNDIHLVYQNAQDKDCKIKIFGEKAENREYTVVSGSIKFFLFL